MKRLVWAVVFSQAIGPVAAALATAPHRLAARASEPEELLDLDQQCTPGTPCALAIRELFSSQWPSMHQFCESFTEAASGELEAAIPGADKAQSGEAGGSGNATDGQLPPEAFRLAVAETCVDYKGDLSALHSACRCIAHGRPCEAEPCRAAMQAQLGGADAMADFCFIGTVANVSAQPAWNKIYTEVQKLKKPDGTAACYDDGDIGTACMCAVPSARDWQFPLCRVFTCYVHLDMLLGASTGRVCRDLLAGRTHAIPHFGMRVFGHDSSCGFKQQIEACRCTQPAPPPLHVGDSCTRTECYKSLKRTLDGHARDFCESVLAQGASEDEKTAGKKLVPAEPGREPAEANIFANARQLRCGRDELLEACRCVRPPPPHAECGGDRCYDTMAALLRSAGAIEGFCAEATLGADSDLEAAVPRLGGGCRDGAAVRKACACAVKEVIPDAECFGNACLRAIKASVKNDIAAVGGFCQWAMRELYEFRHSIYEFRHSIPGRKFYAGDAVAKGCANAGAIYKACSCVVPKEHIWTNGSCAANACYRAIDTNRAAVALVYSVDDDDYGRDFCTSWRRYDEYGEMPQPAVPGPPGRCTTRNVSAACACLSGGARPDAAWRWPACAQHRCYRALDETLRPNKLVDYCRRTLAPRNRRSLPPDEAGRDSAREALPYWARRGPAQDGARPEPAQDEARPESARYESRRDPALEEVPTWAWLACREPEAAEAACGCVKDQLVHEW